MASRFSQHEIFLVGFDKTFSSTLLKCITELRPQISICYFCSGDEAMRALQARACNEQPSLLFITGSLIDCFLWKVKAQRLTRKIPVLVLTKTSLEQTSERGYKLGANSVIKVPPSSVSLRNVLDITLSYWFDFCKLSQGISPLMTGS